MPLLPDLPTAALYAGVVFLLALGFLVVFVETIRATRVLAMLILDAAAALGLASLGEPGLAVVLTGFGAALLANQAFEWLTTR